MVCTTVRVALHSAHIAAQFSSAPPLSQATCSLRQPAKAHGRVVYNSNVLVTRHPSTNVHYVAFDSKRQGRGVDVCGR